MPFLTIILTAFISINVFAEEDLRFKAAEIKSLTIRNSTGNVNVAPATKDEVVIVTNKKKWGSRCKMNVKNDNGHVTISVDDTTWILDHECRVDLVISALKDLKMNLISGTGDISVVGTRGELDVKVGSGAVSINADLARLNALSGSGDIDVNGSAVEAIVKTGNGDINMNFKNKIEKGHLSVQAGNGDVNIYLPSDLKILSNTATGNGQVTNEFETDSKAPFEINAKSGSGDIQIRKQ